MLSTNIKMLREKEGYTQEKLAQYLKVAKNTVSAWECGKRLPGKKHIEALANTFLVSEYDLFCRMDVSDSLSTAIDRLYKLPEHVQFEVIGLIAKLWAEHGKKL